METAPPIPPAPRRRGRWWRRLAWCAGAVLALGLSVYLTRDFWMLTLRSYVIGREYVASEEFGRFLPAVDEVEILALGGESVAAGTPDSFFRDMGGRVGAVNRRTVRGAEAEGIASQWRNIRFGKDYAAMCHDPFYGLRFRRQGKLIFETGVCWHCHTYMLPVSVFGSTEYGFDAKSDAAQQLLATLTQYAPHPATSK